jgi:hypothetical protein
MANNLTSAAKLAADINTLLYNPTLVQRAIYESIDQINEGKYDVMVPTNPAVQLIEQFAVAATGIETRDFISLRKQYAILAQTYEDLYPHMSDRDYLDRFAKPIRIPFIQYFSKDEILAQAVAVGETGTKKIIIPRGTEFTVDNLNFTMEYPLEIRVLSHGAIQCVFDTSVVSPIEVLETNVVDWYYNKFPGQDTEFLFVTIPVTQVKKTTYNETVNPATGFNKNYQIGTSLFNGKADQFYYCRVFGLDANGVRTEYTTTHSQQIYAPEKVTVVLKVTPSNLNITIPQFYINSGMVSSNIDIVIYTTRGAVSVSMPSYSSNAFTRIVGSDLNDNSDSVYVAKYSDLRTYGVGSDAVYSGGSDAISFEDLKNRIIQNANTPNIPITDAQMKATLKVNGYDVIKSIDDIVSRVYLATRNLPAPVTGPNSGITTESSLFTTGAGCAIEMLEITMEALAGLSVVSDNGDRITIRPEALFEYRDGICKIVSDQDRINISNLPIDSLIGEVNRGRFIYTPFHYVLDRTDSVFECRAYFLDNPTIKSRVFVLENDTTGLSVSAGRLLWQKIPTGYKLTVQTRSDDAYKNMDVSKLFCQLAYQPPLESQKAYINGTAIGYLEDELVWEFILETNYDIDKNDFLKLINFSMFVSEIRPFSVPLTQSMDLIFGVSDYLPDTVERTDIDNLVGTHLLDSSVTHLGLTHERLNLELGQPLDGLWSNGSTVAGSIEYQRHTVDYPLTYTETQYEIDPATGRPIFDIVDDEIVFRVTHQIGDPILDVQTGQQLYKYRVGDVVLDVDGFPIEANGRAVTRQIDLMMLDGVYYFTTNPNDLAYKSSIPISIVDFIRNDIDPLRDNLLEKTKLYFYPKRTLGQNKVIVGANLQTNIPAALSFQITYNVNRTTYGNTEYRRTIEQTTSAVINRVLQRSTVAISEITKQLDAAVGDEIISSQVAGLGFNKDIDTYTATDDSVRCGVKRILELQPDETIAVREDIKVDWIRHLNN